MAKTHDMIILIDSREKRPYSFPGAVTQGLPAGDYSLVGLEDSVAVERKCIDELFACTGAGRARFERELDRLSRYEYAAIVIEARLSDILQPSRFSQVSPQAVVGSLISWSVRFGVYVFFAGDRALAQELTYRILASFAKNRASASGAATATTISQDADAQAQVPTYSQRRERQ